jgi:5-methylcytosine-specific restriction protein A
VVTLVCGPPCGGKSRHVDEHARPSDVIVCHDVEARRAGSARRHEHLQHHRRAAELAWRRLVGEVAASADGTAWVIRCAAAGPDRQQLAEQLQATSVLVLMPPMSVALHRAGVDRRARRTYGLIRGWYDRWSPAPVDTVIGTERRTSRTW